MFENTTRPNLAIANIRRVSGNPRWKINFNTADINVHDDITRRQKPDAVRSMSDISQRHAELNTLAYSGLLLWPPYM